MTATIHRLPTAPVPQSRAQREAADMAAFRRAQELTSVLMSANEAFDDLSELLPGACINAMQAELLETLTDKIMPFQVRASALLLTKEPAL